MLYLYKFMIQQMLNWGVGKANCTRLDMFVYMTDKPDHIYCSKNITTNVELGGG